MRFVAMALLRANGCNSSHPQSYPFRLQSAFSMPPFDLHATLAPRICLMRANGRNFTPIAPCRPPMLRHFTDTPASPKAAPQCSTCPALSPPRGLRPSAAVFSLPRVSVKIGSEHVRQKFLFEPESNAMVVYQTTHGQESRE